MIPLLLKPKIWGAKNRWLGRGTREGRRSREIAITIFSIVIIFSIYRTCLSTLAIVREGNLAYLHPSMLLGLLFMLLFAMLFFSNSVAALSTLFMGRDLERLLSSPISNFRFFQGKVLEVAGSSSWMALAFGVPVLVAFGRSYEVSWEFYVLSVVILAPYFFIPAALAVFLVTVFTRLIPPNRTKEILLLVAVAGLCCLYFLFQLISRRSGSVDELDQLLRFIAYLNVPQQTWLPSHWVAKCLGHMLEPQERGFLPYLVLLYSSAAAIGALAYVAYRMLYRIAHTQAQNNRQRFTLKSKSSQRRLRYLIPLASPPFRALLGKELKLFSRDMTQAIQLLLLIGLCMIYLYNFKLLHTVQGLPYATQLWWKAILVLLNIAMGAFVITAVCTRFVFPSISLEGRSMWIILSSPLSFSELLRAKFLMWLVPIATISSVIFVSGALAIQAEPHIIVLNGLASWIICYGVVGLGVGLGAFFSDFNWEYSSQLSASIGSLVYMLACVFLILLNLIPAAALIFLKTLRNFDTGLPQMHWQIYIGLSGLLLIYINYASARWALSIGSRALAERTTLA